MVTKKRNFLEALVVFVAILAWRILVLWRGQINDALWQDEISWNNSASSKTLLENVFLPDSGYPVPLYRLILWVFTKLSPEGYGWLHILSAAMAAASCSSIIILLRNLIKSLPLKVLALILGFFPTFDLLLFHNVAYFLFIPTFCFLYIRILRREFSFFDGLVLSLLIGFCTKPQLLVSILVGLLSLFYFLRTEPIRAIIRLLLPLFSVIILILLGRINSNELDLIWSFRNVCQSLVALLFIPSAIFLPAMSIGFIGFARMQNYIILLWASMITLVVANCLFLARVISMGRSRIQIALNDDKTQNSLMILLLLAPIYISMFVFPNSGWASNFFWDNFCASCAYQRHWFPVMFLLILSMVVSSLKSRLSSILMLGTLLQVSIIAIAAYPYLYFPT